MEKIFVTKTFMPPIDEYVAYLRKIWESALVTNDGPFFQEFEKALAKYTGVEHLVCLSNGTWALQLAVRALGLTGEVITTPFTHVATSDCLVWEGCEPVYCDIDAETLNIDASKIAPLVSSGTTAIMAVHVYGNPCDCAAIRQVAEQYGLKVIYDGAHAFGSNYRGRSVFREGDLSMASFNATKGFHTVEGGALFARDKEMVDRIRKLAYFGMDSNRNIVQPEGTNAKLIEFCAAMGLLNLKYFPAAVIARSERCSQYREMLAVNRKIFYQKITDEINYSYMPIILETEEYKKRVISSLHKEHVFPREYFSPSLETVFKENINCPVAMEISQRVLCLPLSDYLTTAQVGLICRIINSA